MMILVSIVAVDCHIPTYSVIRTLHHISYYYYDDNHDDNISIFSVRIIVDDIGSIVLGLLVLCYYCMC